MKTCPVGSSDAVWYYLAVDILPAAVNSVAVTATVAVWLRDVLALDVAITW